MLAGRGGELEREFAWGVVRQLFEPWLSVHKQTQPSPLFAGSASLAGPVFGADAAPQSRPEESFSTLHGLYWLIVNMSSDVPLLVAVDDLHWADRPSLRFAVYLASRLEGPARPAAGHHQADRFRAGGRHRPARPPEKRPRRRTSAARAVKPGRELRPGPLQAVPLGRRRSSVWPVIK